MGLNGTSSTLVLLLDCLLDDRDVGVLGEGVAEL